MRHDVPWNLLRTTCTNCITRLPVCGHHHHYSQTCRLRRPRRTGKNKKGDKKSKATRPRPCIADNAHNQKERRPRRPRSRCERSLQLIATSPHPETYAASSDGPFAICRLYCEPKTCWLLMLAVSVSVSRNAALRTSGSSLHPLEI